ncbi:Peroxisomal membrane protein PAS20 [Tulasnella sp. 418]|nr:Peroxisomal membrane protein PAS20 [Tulasnella sp. 418]
MPSPPKPWERSAETTVSASAPAISSPAMAAPSETVPAVPSRPQTINSSTSAVTSTALATPSYPAYNSYSSPYSSYTSPYNRFSYNSPYGASFGGYGGYGGGLGGYGGYGMNPPIYGDPNNPSLVQQVQSSTSQTFALIQSIVGTFTGFAQMLDSTFMATHSSFFAMLGVADQFSQLRVALGQVFGMFGFVGWLRGWWTGDRRGFSNDFNRFVRGDTRGIRPVSDPAAPKPSRKPLFVFLLAVFGFPYLMHRLIRLISSRINQTQSLQFGPDGQPIQPNAVDPTSITFARALFAFDTKDQVELALNKGELVAILSTIDPVTGVEGEWWRGRTRDGKEGWFPRTYVEVIQQKSAHGGQTVSTHPKSVE